MKADRTPILNAEGKSQFRVVFESIPMDRFATYAEICGLNPTVNHHSIKAYIGRAKHRGAIEQKPVATVPKTYRKRHRQTIHAYRRTKTLEGLNLREKPEPYKLTAEQCAYIKRNPDGLGVMQRARLFGVHRKMIQMIVKGERRTECDDVTLEGEALRSAAMPALPVPQKETARIG